ncbi:hypothetical protein A3F56_03375 [Candidatus Kaiserbacteria bacterium RIFCSPHIGHO2_12_FULL_55_13]|nr:MAG: hypothetical protein A3F56_03375 [Candidatus Kaiserbacteria bacterium RIFCSPHIGHO2_12_FULL_55_13]
MRKDGDVPPATVRTPEQKPEPKKIIDPSAVDKKEAVKPVIPAKPVATTAPADDDDTWGGLPSFLRRK